MLDWFGSTSIHSVIGRGILCWITDKKTFLFANHRIGWNTFESGIGTIVYNNCISYSNHAITIRWANINDFTASINGPINFIG